MIKVTGSAAKKVWTISVASMIVLTIKAQNTVTESSHSFTVGVGVQIVQEDMLSISSAKLTSTTLGYSFMTESMYRKKSITAVFDRGISSNSKRSLTSNEFFLQYNNLFSVLRNKTGSWNNYTGYSIVINPQYIKAGEQYSWATAGSLSFYNSLVYSWKKSDVSFGFSVPLAGFISRPAANTAYKGSVNDMLYNSFSNLSFASPHNLKAVNLSLQYRAAITNRLNFMTGASFSYKEFSLYNGFLQRSYRLQGGLSYLIR